MVRIRCVSWDRLEIVESSYSFSGSVVVSKLVKSQREVSNTQSNKGYPLLVRSEKKRAHVVAHETLRCESNPDPQSFWDVQEQINLVGVKRWVRFMMLSVGWLVA